MTDEVITLQDQSKAIIGAVINRLPGWNRIPPDIAVKLLHPTDIAIEPHRQELRRGDSVMMFRLNDRNGEVAIRLFSAQQAKDQEAADAAKNRGFESLVFRAAHGVLGAEGAVTVHATTREENTT